MTADSRVVDAVRRHLLAAWPDLGNDPVYLHQLAEEAAAAAQQTIGDILLAGGVPDGVPATARPSDKTLVKGSALTAWLYVTAALNSVEETITDLRRRYAQDLRADPPFALLLKATETDLRQAVLGGRPPARQRPTGNRRAHNRPRIDREDTEEL